MFHVVLVEPEIPQNTGNIARTCAATGCELHLIEPLGFDISEKALRRAGLDYWHLVKVHVHAHFAALKEAYPAAKFHYYTTKSRTVYTDAAVNSGDFLVFGKETKGLPEELLVENRENCVRIPMIDESRSLNLSNAVAIAVYEGLRQNGFRGLQTEGNLHRLSWD